MGFMLEQISNPFRCFYKALAVGTAGDDWCWIPVGNTPQTITSHCRLCFNTKALVTKSDLRAEKNLKQNIVTTTSSQEEVSRNVCFADMCSILSDAFIISTSQVKLYYGSCSVSYIRRRENLELQRLKSPDGTKHAFVKVHLHYTDFIFSPSSQSHSALAF